MYLAVVWPLQPYHCWMHKHYPHVVTQLSGGASIPPRVTFLHISPAEALYSSFASDHPVSRVA